MITKTKETIFRRLLPAAVLALFITMGTALPAAEPDIIAVLIPAGRELGAPKLPDHRYVDGCRIVRIAPTSKRTEPVNLTPGFTSACDPAVSFDGKTILFAGKQTPEAPRRIWRMDADGKNKQPITQGLEDCVSPLYVGSLFHLNDNAPTRKIAYQQDGHLFTCGLDGSDPQRITFNTYPEFSADVLPNGRLIFSSFRQKGRKNVPFKHLDLLAVNIDGTDLMGYVTSAEAPGNKEMVRVGGDGRVYFIESDIRHWLGGGKLSYVSQRRPAHSYRMLADDTDGWYHSPCPMPDGGLTVSFRKRGKNTRFALYTMDPDTGKRLERHWASDALADHHIVDAHPLVSHPVVSGRSSFVEHGLDTGVLFCIDVYISDRPEMKNVVPGSVKQVRVLRHDSPASRLLGVAPVEPDGSFHIRVPSKVPLTFELLNKDGRVISRQVTRTWVMPRESRGCIGCHEDRELSPPNQLAEALTKPAVRLPAPPEKATATHKKAKK